MGGSKTSQAFAPRWNLTHLLWLPLLLLVLGFFTLLRTEIGAERPAASEPILWPLLPGESVNQLASMFYPDNLPLQRRFVAQTLLLSKPVNASIEADAVYDQPVALIIPTQLWQRASPYQAMPRDDAGKLAMSYQLPGVNKLAITPAMQQEYELLNQRNLSLKEKLASLQSRLADLQAYVDLLGKLAQARLQQAQAYAPNAHDAGKAFSAGWLAFAIVLALIAGAAGGAALTRRLGLGVQPKPETAATAH